MNENIQHEYFIWEEKNSTDLNQNLLKSVEQDKCVTITETKTNVENLHWKDITDTKLRRKMYQKAYREINKNKLDDYHKKYYTSNKNQIKNQKKVYNKLNQCKQKTYNQIYYQNNKDELKLNCKTYYNNNKDKVKVQKKVYNELNKNEIKLKKKIYRKINKNKINTHRNNRLKTDVQYKLSCNLRIRLNHAINRNQKAGSAIKDLGCTVDELISYLESKFQPGMSWDNWTIDGWHIDHIKPLDSFDLTNREQFLEACHYTNLQPLWAKDNLSKSNKIT